MSRIVLSGNASGTGTITIAAPNTNADVTLNLPLTGGTLPFQTALTSYTPVATAASGTITTYTSSGAYVKSGALVTFFIEVNITSRGSGTGVLSITLPFPASRTFACAIRETVSSATIIPYATGSAGQSAVGVVNYLNATVLSTQPLNFVLSGTYATAS